MSRLRLTVRTRLTLLYTGLFAVCGAIVVAVSYTLVAGLGASGRRGRASSLLPAIWPALRRSAGPRK